MVVNATGMYGLRARKWYGASTVELLSGSFFVVLRQRVFLLRFLVQLCAVVVVVALLFGVQYVWRNTPEVGRYSVSAATATGIAGEEALMDAARHIVIINEREEGGVGGSRQRHFSVHDSLSGGKFFCLKRATDLIYRSRDECVKDARSDQTRTSS